VKKERIIENSEIGGFEIEDGDMATMDGLDEYLVTGKFRWLPDIHGHGNTLIPLPVLTRKLVTRLGSYRLPLNVEAEKWRVGALPAHGGWECRSPHERVTIEDQNDTLCVHLMHEYATNSMLPLRAISRPLCSSTAAVNVSAQ
jgi:hypothetical protein